MAVDPALGAASIGLVWGWVVGARAGRVVRPLRAVAVLGPASAAIAADAGWMGGPTSVWLFVSAAGLAAAGHAAWRRARLGRPALSAPDLPPV